MTWLLANLTSLLFAAGGGLVALLVAYLKGRSTGKASEKAKQAAQEQKARDIRDEVQNDIGALPADEARKELGTWDR
jgi:hypothetical protein